MTSRQILQKGARDFAESWKDAAYEKSETQTFYNEFFVIFDRNRRDIAVYESQVKNLKGNTAFIDLFWSGTLLVEQKSAGRDLSRAMVQAEEYYIGLEDYEKPRYLLACDFQNWRLIDLEGGKQHDFKLKDLPAHIHLFDFMIKNGNIGAPLDPVSIKASEEMANLYDALKKNRYDTENMEYFLTRLTFCLFADRVGIFPEGAFRSLMQRDMRPGATEVGGKLVQLFEILNTPPETRQANLPDHISIFPYINGNLFNTDIRTPSFDLVSRQILLNALKYDWSKVSPAIFGSLFQSTMDGAERRRTGAHYTPEENIMKVIRPLFLDEINAEFDAICGKVNNHKAFERFQEKLSRLMFFDPACGAGNFLVIAYRELRRLEMKVIREINRHKNVSTMIIPSKVDVNQFYGIEINMFSAKIAETAMWMMDHLMNSELGDMLGQSYSRIPIKSAPSIECADALEINWRDVLEPERCSYVLGNPPFGSQRVMPKKQCDQIKRLSSSGTLDYVCGWFIKASEYAKDWTKIGLVSTNSIAMGEQVWQMRSILERHGMEITFAYDTFPWDSDTRGKANVHVIIMGLCKAGKATKRRLFRGDMEENPKYITPYLFGADKKMPVVKGTASTINGLYEMKMGSQPIDGGHYIFTDLEKLAFLNKEPAAESFLKPYVNAREFINGKKRWILALHNAEPNELQKLPETMKRINAVKDFRSNSKRRGTQNLADTPVLYQLNVLPEKPFLVVPSTSSERRMYVPIGYLEPPAIPSNAMMVIENATLGLFGLLTSYMHMIWLREIGGRLDNRFRYSKAIVYNTFPTPNGNLDVLEPYARAVLDMRDKHADSTLADLYDQRTMPPDLRMAHRKLDRKVDRMYRKEGFKTDMERLMHLLERYGRMTATTPR